MKTGIYLVKLYKSLGKTLQNCLDAVVWYTMTDKEKKEVEDTIKANW